MSHFSQERSSSWIQNVESGYDDLHHDQSPSSTALASSFSHCDGGTGIRQFFSLAYRLLVECLIELCCDKCCLGFRWGWTSSLSITSVDAVVIENQIIEFKCSTMPEVGCRKQSGTEQHREKNISTHTPLSGIFTTGFSSSLLLQDFLALRNGNLVYTSCCWFRGVVGYIACVVYLLSLWPFFPQRSIAAFVVHFLVFILSEIACVFIGKNYLLIWEYEAARYPFFEKVPFLLSPWAIPFLVEVFIWQVSTPPFLVLLPSKFVRFRSVLESLDYVLFLRLYAVLVYYRYVSLNPHSLCRLLHYITRRGGRKINTFFFLRSTLYYHRRIALPLLCFWWWITVGLLYCKSGLSAGSIGDGLWLSFQTLSSLSYGDAVSSSTSYNQWVMWLVWVGSAIIRGYLLVVILWFPLMSSNANYPHSVSLGRVRLGGPEACANNVQVLAECYQLSHLVRDASVKVIQAGWRLHKVRRQGAVKPQERWIRARGVRSSVSLANAQQPPSPFGRGKSRILETFLTLKLAYRLWRLRGQRCALFKAVTHLVVPPKSQLGKVKKAKSQLQESLQHFSSTRAFPTRRDNREACRQSSSDSEANDAAEANNNLLSALKHIQNAINSQNIESDKKRTFEAVESSLFSLIAKMGGQSTLSSISQRSTPPEFSSSHPEEGSILCTSESRSRTNLTSQSFRNSMENVKPKTDEIRRLLECIYQAHRY